MRVCARLVVWVIGAATITAPVPDARAERAEPANSSVRAADSPRRLPRAEAAISTGPVLVSNRYALRRLTSEPPTGEAPLALPTAEATSSTSRSTTSTTSVDPTSSQASESVEPNDDLLAPDDASPADERATDGGRSTDTEANEPDADDDDLLTDESESPDSSSREPQQPATDSPPSQQAAGTGASDKKPADATKDPHAELFSKCRYPSAKECATCHEQIYREWSVSSHAYAGISPMFHKFEQRINELARGTIGHFCMRCHAPVASDMGLPREVNVLETIAAAQEGVTCIACHRVVEQYGRRER